MTSYSLIGHVTQDILPNTTQLGGTVAYAGLTAKALGSETHVLTACADTLDLSPLQALNISRLPSKKTTVFENQQTPSGRTQLVYSVAEPIPPSAILKNINRTDIIHFAPIMKEFDCSLLPLLPSDGFIGLTPQGWMRAIGTDMRVQKTAWRPEAQILQKADAIVISEEDIDIFPDVLDIYRLNCPIVALTRGKEGAYIFMHDLHHDIPAPQMEVKDTTGAGDIFAAAFFIALQQNHNPLASGKFAVNLASASVTRSGLNSIPTLQEIQYNSGILHSS